MSNSFSFVTTTHCFFCALKRLPGGQHSCQYQFQRSGLQSLGRRGSNAAVGRLLSARGLRIHVDVSNDKLGAKIRNARNLRYPYICVIGDAEAAASTLAVRSATDGELGAMSVSDFTERLLEEAKPPRLQRTAP